MADDINVTIEESDTIEVTIEGGVSEGKVTSVNSETGEVVLTTGNIVEDTDKNYVTDANLVVIGNTSNINTGDEDLSDLALKSNVLELDNTDTFTPDNDYEPATKKYVDDNAGGSYTFTNGLNEASNTAKLVLSLQ